MPSAAASFDDGALQQSPKLNEEALTRFASTHPVFSAEEISRSGLKEINALD